MELTEAIRICPMGFATELEHFRRVVEDGMPSESDIASAAAMLQLTGEIAAEALAGTS